MSKKVKIILFIVWVLAALAYHCSHSKAESATADPALFPIPTFNPDPEAGYQDYLNLLSFYPVIPTPSLVPDRPPLGDPSFDTPDPFLYTPSPTADPFPIPTAANYKYYLFDSFRNQYTNGSIWDSSIRGIPFKSATPFRNGFRLTDVNLSNSWCILDDSSDFFNLNFLITSLNLPSGYSIDINLLNNFISFQQLSAFTDLSLPSLDISAVFDFTFSDLSLYSDTVLLSVDEFINGFTYSFLNDRSSSLSRLSITFIIKNSNPSLDDGSIIPIALNSSNNNITSFVYFTFSSPSNSNTAVEEQTSVIGRFFSNLLNGIVRLFIPDSNELQSFINSKVQSLEGNPLGLAWTFGIRWLNILAAPDDTPPAIHIPSYSLNINGSSYELFSSFDVDFSVFPQNLLTYTRMIGDIVLSLAFVRYLSRKMVALFNIKFADTVLDIDDGSDPSAFD